MQDDTNLLSPAGTNAATEVFTVGPAQFIPPGHRVTAELSNGVQLAVFNVAGELYAIENSCPHKGAPLSEGIMSGHMIECGWHHWSFDVRTGECATNFIQTRSYQVFVEDALVKIRL